VAGAIAGPTGIRHCLCVSYMYTCKGVVASRLRHGTVQLLREKNKPRDDGEKIKGVLLRGESKHTMK
jgi:hypothetical protein